MRPIKLRVMLNEKSMNSGQWVYYNVLEFVGVNTAALKIETAGLFTGLYDCKDQPIYEGDILKIEQFSFYVTYDQGCFVVQENPKSEMYFSLSNINKFSEIIGNIHEHKELLGDK